MQLSPPEKLLSPVIPKNHPKRIPLGCGLAQSLRWGLFTNPSPIPKSLPAFQHRQNAESNNTAMIKWESGRGRNREKPKGIGFKPESGNRWESMRRRNTRKRLILPQGAAKVKYPSRERDGKGIS